MAIFPASAPPVFWWMNNSAVSSDLRVAFAFDPDTRARAGTAPISTGATTYNEPIDVESAQPGNMPSFLYPAHGFFWFERIHLLPARKAYPFILSPQHVFVEVYNAFKLTAQTVDDIIETGPAGVTILTAHVTPIVFAPLQSRTYDILIDAAGPPRADNFITWDFTGVPEPTLHLTGLRLLPFTIPPDWDAGIDDVRAYATDVLTAYDETEQRIMLRNVPNRSLSYKASGLDPRESNLLAGLLWSWQARSYGVLLWMDAAPLGLDVVAGTVDLVVDTTDMTLEVGDTVILIVDAFRWFASPIAEFTPGSIKLETALDRDFFAGVTKVIPVILGRVAAEVGMDRPTNDSTIIPIKFDLQVVKAL